LDAFQQGPCHNGKETQSITFREELAMKPPLHQQRRDLAFALRQQGKTFRQIGKVLGVCPERAREIYGRAREITLGRHHWTEGLSIRIQNVLLNAGLFTMEAVEEAIKARKLRPHWRPLKVEKLRNYGKKSHYELCEFLGVK
jgi:hypothetical protein